MTVIGAVCHQIPGMAAVMRHLGLFYCWRPFNVVPVLGRIVCR